jgi:hypothetical protein
MNDKRVVGFKAKIRLKQPKGPPSSIIKMLMAENPDGWLRLDEVAKTRKEMRKRLAAQGHVGKDVRLIRLTRKPFPGLALFLCMGKTEDGRLDWHRAVVVHELYDPERMNRPEMFGYPASGSTGAGSTRDIFKAEARERFEARCKASGVPVGLFKGLRRKWMLADRINEVLHPWVQAFDRNADYPHHHLSEIVVMRGTEPLFRMRRRSDQTALELFQEVCKTYRERQSPSPEFAEGSPLGDLPFQLTLPRSQRDGEVFLRRVWRKGPPPKKAEDACRGRKRFPQYKPAYAAAMKSVAIGRGRMIVQPCPECQGFHLAKHRPGRDGQSAQPKV